MSEDGSTSSASSVEGDIISTSSEYEDCNNVYESSSDTSKNDRNLDLIRFVEDERTQDLYKRYKRSYSDHF